MNSTLQKIRVGFRHLVNDPLIGWPVILCLAVAATLFLVGVGVYVYLDVEGRLEAPATPPAPNHAVFDPTALKSVMSDADMRAAVRADKAANYPLPPDPSLP